MKKAILNSLLCLGCVAAFSSCSKDENTSGMVGNSSTISFASQVITTKAGAITGTTFPSGDKVGVFAIQHPLADAGAGAWTDSPFMPNQETIVGSDGKTLTYSPLKNYPESDKLDFYAYYPYNASAVSAAATGFSLPVTLATAAVDQVDYLYATPVIGITKPTIITPISFTFKHALSLVKFVIEKDDVVSDEVKLTNLAVAGNSAGTMDIATGIFSSLSTPIDFSVYSDPTGVVVNDVTSNGTAITNQLMLFPCAAADLTFKLTISGSSYSFVPSVPVAGLKGGQIYTYKLKYTGNKITFVTATIEPWTDGGPLDTIDITN